MLLEHNFESTVINGTLVDIGKQLNQKLDVEQPRNSSGRIKKDGKYKMNKYIGKHQFLPERKSCHTNGITSLIAQQTFVAINLILPLNIHNQLNNNRNIIKTPLMREVESNLVHYQTNDNKESRRNTKATLLLFVMMRSIKMMLTIRSIY